MTVAQIIKPQQDHVTAEASARQREASDPQISAWVGASAGSGKTKVLTDRILRLLLPRPDGRPGTAPDKILAITFTKAGANEMALRLSKRLSSWTAMDDDALSKDIEENLFGRTPNKTECEEARKLFAKVVDTPGGLKIMTIHSFCQSILGRFPLEAGISPNFHPLEEGDAMRLLQESRKDILARAIKDRSSPLGQAVSSIAVTLNEEQFDKALSSLISERHQLQEILKRTFGMDGLYTNLCREFGFTPGLTDETAMHDFCSMDSEAESNIRAFFKAMLEGSKEDQKKANFMEGFMAASVQERPLHYDDYKRGFTTDGKPYARVATQAVLNKNPELLEIASNEAQRIADFEELRKKISCASLTADLFRIGHEVISQYQLKKGTIGALDFDDLILRTLDLLGGNAPKLNGLDAAPWIRFKLDEGLDHILVDEAQDTNPEQWEIIRLLADEFFSGEGARESERTLFVVGDQKQSIFSFQRAEPKKFDDMQAYFEEKIKSAGYDFRNIDINTSFRSVQAVLDTVDGVFETGNNAPSLGARYLNHVASRAGQAGLVELWPILRTTKDDSHEAGDETEGDGWVVPDKIVEGQSGASQMAVRIADTIGEWLDTGEILESYARPIQAGDIMILVRTRGAFVTQLVRALKVRNIPVSGVDRIVLEEQIAVQDICAAAAFALQPEDDLTLACLLKSPFVGLNEDKLYAISYGRTASLWKSLRENGDAILISWLEKLISYAADARPYVFFSRLAEESCPANEHSGMRAIRARLGEDALDPLDECLNAALKFEAMHKGGLQAFLKWMESDSREIKRELGTSTGAVRIMTVHGSKGLQAPIVFLPDTVRVAAGAKKDPLLWPHRTGMDVPLYVSSKQSAPASALDIREQTDLKSDEEYRRLLYVAMTRAEERLYVGGFAGKRGPSENSKTAYWYDDIRTALERRDDIAQIPSGIIDESGKDMPILRISYKNNAPPDKKHPSDNIAPESAKTALPAWALKAAPLEPTPPKPLSPSRPSESEPAARSPLAQGEAYRYRRGNLTHRLLQLLPDISKDIRRSAAEKFLSQKAHDLTEDMRNDIVNEIITILTDPVFGDIFGPRSMAEIPLAGLLPDGRLVSAQIDRLLIEEDTILIVDYKTNRPPPMLLEDVSPSYRRQMEMYAALLRTIYPAKTVRTALLWTDGARLMEIPV